ncbi:MAG: DUF721 domain-containing protein [Planctomycetales bacterium]
MGKRKGQGKGKPEKIGELVARLMMQRGYGRITADKDLAEAWAEVAGEDVASFTRVGKLNRGTLEIIVTHSALIQEMAFQKDDLLKRFQEHMPGEKIEKLRFRLGAVK